MINSTTPAPFRSLLPDDEADDRLRQAVHPDDWTNPQPRSRYHLVVVGAGTGGLVTASIAAGLGARVALVERGLMGGDCLTVGCVPSKSIIRASRAWNEARIAAQSYGGPVAAGDGDFGAVMERMRRARAGLAVVDGARRFRDLGVDVFLGDARFTSADTLQVGDGVLRFRRAVIATGARATVPDVPGLREAPYHTNETIFTLTRRPAHLVIIGAGAIGCELAQAFARLGTRVTLIDQGDRVLFNEEPEAAAIVEAAMLRDGVVVLHGAHASRVITRGEVCSVEVRGPRGSELLECDTLLVATGRTPNVDGLCLEEADVRYDALKGVVVNDRLRTSNRRIFAVGDVCSSKKFTHLADFHARIVVPNALFFMRHSASKLVTPRVTYTSPEVAHVGMTAADAVSQQVETDVVDVQMSEVDRAVLDGETEGFCRVRLARGSDRILGVTIVGAHAGEMISEATLAMTARLGLGKIGGTMHPYPTQAEVLRKASDAWQRRKLPPRVKRLFGWYFRMLP
ncbi:MAG: mercuric reductase [Polaromonas sp.]|nr:mercuric reductase [Gemmatimonadaceae bacterium]